MANPPKPKPPAGYSLGVFAQNNAEVLSKAGPMSDSERAYQERSERYKNAWQPAWVREQQAKFGNK